MQRRTVLFAAAGMTLAALVSSAGAQAPAPRTAAAAQGEVDALHRRLLTLDSHVDVAAPDASKDDASLAQLQAGGVDAVVLAVFAPTGPNTPEGRAAARREAEGKLSVIQALARDHPQEVEIARGAPEVRRIVSAGKVAVIIGFLNAYWLDGPQDFDRLHAEGVRVAGLAHAGDNAFADSSRPKSGEGAPFGGLSDKGKAAVRRLNDLGVLVDVSQLTPQGVFQTLAISRAPVVATHSDVRALIDNPRKGGVIQVTPFNAYLSPRPADYAARLAALRAEYGLTQGTGEEGVASLPPDRKAAFMTGYRALTPRATLKQYVDHIDYIARRVGVEHVGIGSDFNHGAGITGFANEGEAANVTRELVARGYSESDISKIWGGNFLRVLAAAENERTIR